MASNGGKINFQVGFNVDKSGLSQMQSLFQQIASLAQEPANKLNTGLQQAAKTASTLDEILSRTFNTELGTLNVTKFNQELKNSGLTLKTIQADFNRIGTQGTDAYNRLAQAVLGTNQQLKQSSKLLNDMFTTFKNTVRYGISSSIFNNMANSIQKAYDYSRQLDTSLNDIRIVTDKSAESMADFAKQANEAAKGMGASTLDYTNAALIYYQQGLSDAEVAARAETTIKAANVTGQTGEEVSEQLTAVWNGYKVTAEETELYVDKLAAVAATTAADLEELSVGMSKVASAANAMGVDFDDLNAQIATIVSVTRQAPESVGTALKTIYARLGDLKVDGVDEFGVSLGEVSEQMVQMGIQILDQNGDLRDMSSVIAEVAEKWSGWTQAQRQAAAVAMAGKRQYNNLIALFDNWDMYTEALNTSTEAVGTLQHQQDIYMESTAAKLKTLKAAWQGLYDDAINEDEINAGIEALTNLVEVFDNFIDSFGGGIKSIAGFGAIISSIFNKQIADSINTVNQRVQVFKNNLELAQTANNIRMQGASPEGSAAIQANTEAQIQYSQKIYDARLGLNQEQANTLINLQKEIGQTQELLILDENRINRFEQRSTLEQNDINFIKQYAGNLDEINWRYEGQEELIRQQQNEASKLLQIWEKLDEEESFYVWDLKEAQEVKSQLNRLAQGLNEEEKQAWNTLSGQLRTEMDFATKQEDVLEVLRQIVDANKINLSNAQKQTQEARKLSGMYEQMYSNQSKNNSAKQQADDMLKAAQSASTLTQKLTTVTSALGNMAMAWSSISSLIDTWNNDQASFGDKLTQTFMTLGFTLPMVISNFSKLNETISFTKAVTSLSTLATQDQNRANAASIAIKQADLAISKLSCAEDEKEVALILSKITAEEAEAIATGKVTVAEVANNIANQNDIFLTKEQIAAIYSKIIAKKAETAAVDAHTKALIAEKAATLGIIAIVGVALVAAIAIAIKSIEKWHEAEKKEAEETLNSVKAKQEEIKANKELYDSYNKLYSQYKDTGEVSEDLFNTTIELAEAYNIQNARVLALAGNYEELTRQIKEARKAELEQSNREANKGIQAATQHIAHDITSGRGNLFGGEYNFSAGVANAGTNEYNQMINAVRAAGLEQNVSNGIFSMSVDYSDPKAIAEWMKQVDNMVDYMEAAYSSAELAHNNFYKQIKKDQEDGAEYYQELQNQLNTLYSGQTELAFLEVDLDSVKNATQLQSIIDEIRQKLEKSISIDQVDDFINSYLKGIDSVSDELDKINIAEKISKQTGQELKEILSQIDHFNNEQLAFLSIHLNTGILSDDLNQWIEDNKEYISLIAKQNSVQSFKGLLEGYSSDEGYSQEQLSGIYQNETMSGFMSVSETTLSTMDSAQQLDQLTKAWIENTKYVVENRDKVKNALEEEYRKLAENSVEKENAYQKEKNALDQIIEGSEKYSDQASELTSIIKQLGTEGYDSLTYAQKGLLKAFEEDTHVREETLALYGKQISEGEQYISSLKDLEKRIQDVSDVELNYAEILEQVSQNIAEHNSIIDSIQDAYKSLMGIIDSYNETGAFTIDNVQQLMTMSDKYVAQLQFEGNQLSLNEAGFQALTIAKINDLEQTAVLTAQEELEALAEEKVTDASLSATSAILNAAAAARDASEAAKEGAAAWDAYAASMRAAAGVSGSQYDAKAKEITDALRVRLLAAENAKSQVGKGGSAMRSTMGASSKSSGGSSKEKKDKELKKLEDEFDRYWEINKALDAIDRNLKKIDKDQENLYGKELIRSLKQENELLDNQAQLYEQLYAAQQAEAAELRGQLSSMGVSFDASSGAITNYAQAVAQALATYNAAVTAFNSGPQDEAAQKSLEAAEKAYENFKKLIERYDTLVYNEMQDTQEKLDEIWRKQLANNLKAWEVEIQLKLDFKELEREWNDFMKEVTSDFKKVFKDLRVESKNMLKDATTYVGEEGTINTIIGAVHDVTGEIDKMMSGGSSDMFESVSQAQEKLKELNDKLLESGQSLHDLWGDAWDNYLDGIDQVDEKFEDISDRYERINEELEFQGQLIELLYGDEAYALMSKYYEGLEKNTMGQIESTKQQVDMWKQLFEASGASMDNQLDWDEDQKKYYEKWMEAQSKLNDLVIDYIELLKKDYLNTVSDVLKELEKYVTGSSLEDINTEWERISANADKYYDSVEGAYYIQTLANKIDQSIADANNLKAQQKLMALREKEIDYLREKENLTEYDIKAAELRYQLALKEIALEDAQNNKTGMKLTRNDQGNWSYQYVADESDIISKRQELLDTYNSLYQLASDAYEANLEALQELQEKYLESAKKIYEDDTLTEEERQQKLLELRDWYLQEYQKLAEENQLYRNDLATAGAGLLLKLYEQDQTAYESMTETERELVDTLTKENISDYGELEEAVKDNYQGIKDKAEEVMRDTRQDWTSGAQTIADRWNKDNGFSVKTEVVKAYDRIEVANQDYQKAVDECAQKVERDFTEQGIMGAIQRAEDETDNLKDKTIELVNESIPYLQALKGYVDEIGAAWQSVQDQIMAAINLIDEYLRKVGGANAAVQKQAEIAQQQAAAAQTTKTSKEKESNTSSRPVNTESDPVGHYYYTAYSNPNGVQGAWKVTSTSGQSVIVGGIDSNQNYVAAQKEAIAEALKRNGHFATGGYTGDWSNTDGKLALLDSKELVLNADDTKNFLSGINTIRDLSSSVGGSIQDAVLKAVANTALSLGSIKASGVMGNIANNNSSTDNVFNITAEFPNANSVDDIREAILSLPNIASQYANSTLK